MIVDGAWAQRNIGFDPTTVPAQVGAPTDASGDIPDDLQREIIDFDSEGPVGQRFFAFSTATGMSRFTDIPWPKGLAPKTGPKPKGTGKGPLPPAWPGSV